MTPAEMIKPYLVEADRQHPELKTINTALSCFDLLQLTLKLAGPEWAFVGKTRDKDGASVTPQGFAPVTMKLTRPDGQLDTVTIVGVSQDAAFHLPTHRQVKVIANSSANDDPNVMIHGDARLDPYGIDPQYYRWHNPPIEQSLLGVIPNQPVPHPIPTPTPQAPASKPYPGDPIWDAVGATLFADYAEAGQAPNPQMGRWFGRTIWDATEGDEAGHVLTVDASIKKHRNEWRGELRLPALP